MTHEQLEAYISGFNENQRETVYKQILDAELLRKAFETSEGKMILNNSVDLITSNVMQIVRYCAENNPSDATMKIYPYAQEINTTYKLMTDWAKTLIRGSEHKERAEKLPIKKEILKNAR